MAASSTKLIDVARLAQVSTATVSRALSNPGRVSAQALRRVESAVQQLRYVPHGAARALRSQRTRAIGAVVPTLSNAIFADYTQALHKALEARGYRMLLACNEYDPVSEEALVAPLLEHGIDALVLVGRDHSAGLFRNMEEHRLPYVLTWTTSDSSERPCIGFRNREAAAHVADYLIDLQHREFAMIAGIGRGNDRARERVEGVRMALAARGLQLKPARILESPYSFMAGRQAMRKLMSLTPQPTAVICGNDVLAIGALAECHAMGVDVPRTVSITGFDDMQMASITIPPLTTVRVPTEKLGQLAADYIVNRVEGAEGTVTPELTVDLVVRGTTGPSRNR
ncbi:MAG: hypothetical protein A3F74_23025 [Betaproteobacteria bacterium RIFCSPLOWO2_12_FULL_62_58]|nr:MAG: hypothetical protein A3F74_23025 [Betaproteobacteria bacterium RIFCSPLOWO2_12_FULL_62_58]